MHCYFDNRKRFEFSRNITKLSMLAFCTTSKEHKLKVFVNDINFTTNVHLSWCFKLKLIIISILYSSQIKAIHNANIGNFVHYGKHSARRHWKSKKLRKTRILNFLQPPPNSFLPPTTDFWHFNKLTTVTKMYLLLSKIYHPQKIIFAIPPLSFNGL